MRTEFEFLSGLRRKYSLSAIGDDCAVIPQTDGSDLVITADMLVENIDFRLEWASPESIGYKTLAVSLSDVAAMGAEPRWAMLSIGIPETVWSGDFIDRFYEGWHRLASPYGVELIGGDISRTPDTIIIDSIAAGVVEPGSAVRRSTAKSGDSIYVTGTIGGAARGLELLENGYRIGPDDAGWKRILALRQLEPQPQIEAGIYLRTWHLATAMIDISDGLSSDLHHLCDASRVGALIYADKLPVDPAVKAFASVRDEQLKYALNGGEDFELLFTAAAGIDTSPRTVTCIGEITETAGTIEIVSGGRTQPLDPEGFRHF